MSWAARSPGLLGAGAPGEIRLDGTTLSARRGTIAWNFDLTAPGTEVGFHHWGLSRGTLLRVCAGKSSLFVGGDSFLSSDLVYQAPLARKPDLILSPQHFAELVGQLPKQVLPTETSGRSYWLWNNGLRLLPALVHVLYVLALLLAMVVSLRISPRVRGVGTALAFLAALVLLEVARNRRTSRPALRLTFDGDRLMFARPNAARPFAECAVAALDVQPSHWTAPTMGGTAAYETVELPSVTVTKALPQPLSIGGLGYGEATNGPKTVPPRYLLSPPCWASFADALLGRPTTDTATPEPQRQDGGTA